MRRLLLAGVSAIAIAVAAAGSAKATLFSYDGTVDSYVVPTTGEYDISSPGAQGARADNSSGGLGAKVGGDIS